MRRSRSLLVLALAALLALPAAAPAASKYPRVTKVRPLDASIGDTLTISGSGFNRGVGRNTVVFRAPNGRAVFVKAGRSTTKRILVKLPGKLEPFLLRRDGRAVSTRFKVRVLSKRFAKSFTGTASSPKIGPEPAGGSGGAGPSDPKVDCDAGNFLNKDEADDAADLLADTLEASLKTDPCLPDTDLDGVEDGYEHESAIDLNSRALPYPGKRPYPNALDPSDARTDYDGDGLDLVDEYRLWTRYGDHALPLNYSDGDQATGDAVPAPVNPLLAHLDMDLDGVLADDERDADNDGLGNWDESHGRMSAVWWEKTFDKDPWKETKYTITFAGTALDDPDTDGDGLIDGLDDQDFDGYSNAFEILRPFDWATTYVSDAHPGTNPFARVNPFNPCKPTDSAACHKHPPFDYYRADEDWHSPFPTVPVPLRP